MDDIQELHHQVERAAKGFDGFVSAYADRLRAISRGDRVAFDWRSTSDEVCRYLNGDFRPLCRALELMKTCEADAFVGAFAQGFFDTMMRLGDVAAGESKRFSVEIRRDFTWSAQILLAVFRPQNFGTKHMPSAFVGNFSRAAFRRKVVDRILKVLRGLMLRLRDGARLVDQKVDRSPDPFRDLRHDLQALAELVRELQQRFALWREAFLNGLFCDLAGQRRYLCLLAHGHSGAGEYHLN